MVLAQTIIFWIISHWREASTSFLKQDDEVQKHPIVPAGVNPKRVFTGRVNKNQPPDHQKNHVMLAKVLRGKIPKFNQRKRREKGNTLALDHGSRHHLQHPCVTYSPNFINKHIYRTEWQHSYHHRVTVLFTAYNSPSVGVAWPPGRGGGGGGGGIKQSLEASVNYAQL